MLGGLMNGVFVALEIGGLVVVLSLHNAEDPSADDWKKYLNVSGQALKKVHDDVDKLRNLVITDGGAPNAKQRKQMADLVHSRANKIGVLTNSLENPIKRGVATAITWLNPAFRAVMPARWHELFAHLDLERHVHPLLAEFDQMQRQLSPVATLTEVKRLVASRR
jgi:hypothetical protein